MFSTTFSLDENQWYYRPPSPAYSSGCLACISKITMASWCCKSPQSGKAYIMLYEVPYKLGCAIILFFNSTPAAVSLPGRCHQTQRDWNTQQRYSRTLGKSRQRFFKSIPATMKTSSRYGGSPDLVSTTGPGLYVLWEALSTLPPQVFLTAWLLPDVPDTFNFRVVNENLKAGHEAFSSKYISVKYIVGSSVYLVAQVMYPQYFILYVVINHSNFFSLMVNRVLKKPAFVRTPRRWISPASGFCNISRGITWGTSPMEEVWTTALYQFFSLSWMITPNFHYVHPACSPAYSHSLLRFIESESAASMQGLTWHVTDIHTCLTTVRSLQHIRCLPLSIESSTRTLRKLSGCSLLFHHTMLDSRPFE